MKQSLSELERWHGGFPGEHEFSDLGGLKADSSNPGVESFIDSASKLVCGWRGNKFAGLYLYGTPGTGKTHAAIGLGRALHEEDSEINYVFGPNLRKSGFLDYTNIQNWTNERQNASFRTPFPSSHGVGCVRNPMSVLIFDDYQSHLQPVLNVAVEAAAQYGGLVVVTSNYPDPFKIVEVAAPELTAESVITSSLIDTLSPELAEKFAAQRDAKLQAISDSLRSRVVSGFRLIEFSGPDRRTEYSFWES